MRDEELKRNGSGYYDETAYKAMTAGPQPGEIWQGHNDRIYRGRCFFCAVKLKGGDDCEQAAAAVL